MKIAIVAGEISGDILGASLVENFKKQLPDCQIIGVAGAEMTAAGCEPIADVDELAVFGLFEVLKHLPRLFRLRSRLVKRITEFQPDVFIGIDAPDFNIGLEQRLHDRGIFTVHYVSPSVWAWRPKRVKKIAPAVDLMLTLFPFEVDFYREHNVHARCVGHPMADSVADQPDKQAACLELGLNPQQPVLAILPGSRGSEVKYLGTKFVETMRLLQQQQPHLQMVIPIAKQGLRPQIEALLAQYQLQNVLLLNGQARQAMTAADTVLLASGTATLEAMLLKRPMVVAYRLARLTYWVLTYFKIMKIDRFALPNLLIHKNTVPEFIQNDVDPARMGEAVKHWLTDPDATNQLKKTFETEHHNLRRNAGETAVQTILEVLKSSSR